MREFVKSEISETEPQQSLSLGLGLTTVLRNRALPSVTVTTQNVNETRELRVKEKG